MIKNYFKIAWNNLKRNKVFSFINIFGLSVGLASCMLITLYIINELSYDRYQQHGDQIYQVATTFIQQGKETKMPNTPAPLAMAMQQEFPEVEQSTRLMGLFAEDKTLLQYKERISGRMATTLPTTICFSATCRLSQAVILKTSLQNSLPLSISTQART
ncbi:MAG: ABC transporter permease [Chitinophagaceae bacterium]|nr:ABC transporter permease [Chitinophagaceae bacterium]